MLSNLQVLWVEALCKSTRERVESGHAAYEARHGVACNYQVLFLEARIGGQVVGVLSGYTAYAEVYVDDLWVQSEHRRKGIGRKLLRELEKRYADRGFDNINLVTNEFQAPEFYRKCGYEVEFVRLNRRNPKLNKTFFVKYFDNPEPPF